MPATQDSSTELVTTDENMQPLVAVLEPAPDLSEDLFGFEKESEDPKGREVFDGALQCIWDYAVRAGRTTELLRDSGYALSLPPVRAKGLDIQIVCSSQDGTDVIGVHGLLEAETVAQPGFFLVRGPTGQVAVVDMQLRRVLSSSSDDYEKYLLHAKEYIRLYVDALPKIEIEDARESTVEAVESAEEQGLQVLFREFFDGGGFRELVRNIRAEMTRRSIAEKP